MSTPEPTPPARDTSLLVGRRYTAAWLMGLAGIAIYALDRQDSLLVGLLGFALLLSGILITGHGYRARMLTQEEANRFGPTF